MYDQVCYKKEDVYLSCHFSCQYIQTYDLHGVPLDGMHDLPDLVEHDRAWELGLLCTLALPREHGGLREPSLALCALTSPVCKC